jgi:hypothetical protein
VKYEFWDLAGEKSQRQHLGVYYQKQLSNFKAILFFFDVNNEKTAVKNFSKWIKLIFEELF